MTKLMLCVAMLIRFVAQAQEVDTILKNHFERTGGLNGWKALNTLKLNGEINNGGQNYAVSIYRKIDDKVRQEYASSGLMNVRGYDGETAWTFFNGQTTLLNQESSKDLRGQPLMNEFIDYKTRGFVVDYVGIKEINRTPCYEIGLTKRDGDETYVETYYFDQKDYTVIMKSFVARAGQFMGSTVEVYYNDYRRVEGLQFPFRVETKSNGAVIQTAKWKEIAINVPMSDMLFSPPSAANNNSSSYAYSSGNMIIRNNVVTIDGQGGKSSINVDSIMESVSGILKNANAGGGAVISNGVTIIDSREGKSGASLLGKGDEWYDEDYRKVAERLFSSLSASSKLSEYQEKLGKRAFLTIGEIHNSNSQRVDVDGLIRKFEYLIFNSNVLEIVESTAFRDKVRQERAEQSDFEKDEALKKWGKEAGADLILFGELTVRSERHKNKLVNVYTISVFITDVITNARVWFGQEEVRK